MIQPWVKAFSRYRPFVVGVAAVLLITLVSHDTDPEKVRRAPVAAEEASAGAVDRTEDAGGTTGPATGGPAVAARTVPGARAASAASIGGGVRPPAAPVGTGVGTPEALSSASCDSTLGRIKVPFKYAPPCVRPWPKGADNGGTTSQGVTADSITIVVVGGGTLDTAANRNEVYQSVKDLAQIFERTYETWGRKVNVLWRDFGAGSTPDEAQQRAMAVEVAGLRPFAVLSLAGSSAGGPAVFVRDLARKGIVTFGYADLSTFQALAPYVWSTLIVEASEPLYCMGAEYIAKRLMGRPARWAGQIDYQQRTRTFGLVYPEVADAKVIKGCFERFGVKLATESAYPANPNDFAAQAPTIIAKLKDAGVTTIINGADAYNQITLTQQATNQLYFPEWALNGGGGNDSAFFGRGQDQQQMAHMFGFGQIPPNGGTKLWRVALVDWYYGEGAPAWRDGTNQPLFILTMQNLMPFYLGVHLAGPNLNPMTFRDGLWSFPPSGGYACGCITLSRFSYGRQGGEIPDLGWDDYQWPDDVNEKWWDPNLVGYDEQLGLEAPGNWRYMNKGQHTGFGRWPAGEPPAFDTRGTIVNNDLRTLPASDATPAYPCVGCPSTAEAG